MLKPPKKLLVMRRIPGDRPCNQVGAFLEIGHATRLGHPWGIETPALDGER